MSNVNLYINQYRRLLQKRCRLDARIDFVEDLIRSCVLDNAVDFEIVWKNNKGEVLKKIS